MNKSINYFEQMRQASSSMKTRFENMDSFMKDKVSTYTQIHDEFTFIIADQENKEVTAYLKRNGWL